MNKNEQRKKELNETEHVLHQGPFVYLEWVNKLPIKFIDRYKQIKNGGPFQGCDSKQINRLSESLDCKQIIKPFFPERLLIF